MIEAVARRIAEARAQGRPVPLATQLMTGLTTAQAIRIQEHGLGDRLRAPMPPVYKLSMLPQPAVGLIAQNRLARDCAHVAPRAAYQWFVEAELVILVDRNGRPTGYAAGLELPSSSFRPTDGARAEDIIADNLVADCAVIGAVQSNLARSDIERIAVTLTVDDRPSGACALQGGEPWARAEAMLSLIRRQGWPLADGTMLFTGTLFPVAAAQPGSHYCADFGLLGRVSARISAV